MNYRIAVKIVTCKSSLCKNKEKVKKAKEIINKSCRGNFIFLW
jgi:hypothetical protein